MDRHKVHWSSSNFTEVFTGVVLDRGEDQQSLPTITNVDVHRKVFITELWWISKKKLGYG